jgi:large subunit ribosomal protein L25
MATATTPKGTLKTLKVEPRTELGSRRTFRLRNAGKMPVVIYGHKKDPLHVSADAKQMSDLLHEHTRLLEVHVDNHVEPCLIKEVQWNHLGSQIIHVDLARVDLTEKVTVPVLVVLIGEPKGAKEAGAFLSHPVTEIEVECLVTQIPDEILADVANLGVDESLTAGELTLPEGVKLVSEPDTIIAQVQIAQEEEEPVVAAEGEAAEPELIRKPAAEGEGDDAAAAPAGKAEKAKKE